MSWPYRHKYDKSALNAKFFHFRFVVADKRVIVVPDQHWDSTEWERGGGRGEGERGEGGRGEGGERQYVHVCTYSVNRIQGGMYKVSIE